MGRSLDEWIRQADYDMDTAEFMFGGGRYFYVVFMCHLSIEKALKGLYLRKLNEEPPRVHNLIFLLEKIGLELPEEISGWLFNLNRVSIPTRYPDDLLKIQKEYDKDKTRMMLEKSKELLKWIKARS